MKYDLAAPGIRIAPSILSADFTRLAEDIAVVEQAGADILHLDVMDGHFVPNITFGPPLVKSIRKATKLFLDTHLMITDPEKYAEPFAKAGADLLTFHIEVAEKPKEIVAQLRSLGVGVGVSLNPTTPAEALDPILSDIDLVLVMSVWPGFGGQSFMPEVLEKTRQIRKRLRPDQRLEMDGGIDSQTITQAVEAGVDTFVAGSAIFGANSPAQAVDNLRQAAQAACKA